MIFCDRPLMVSGLTNAVVACTLAVTQFNEAVSAGDADEAADALAAADEHLATARDAVQVAFRGLDDTARTTS